MSDTEIETIIRRLLLYKKIYNNSKENEKHIEDIQKELIQICEKFHFFIKKILTNKNINGIKMIKDIINHIEFIYVKEKEIIWNVGDRINEMYIIFLGEVNIYKQQNKNVPEEPILECTLEKGYSIGEEFLKNNSIRRTYIAEAKTFCILGKLSIKEYRRIFDKMLNDENILINSFLKELKMFSYDFIDRFQKYLSINYYNKNEYIFRQNQTFNTFYFIFSGRVRITVNLKKKVKSKIDHDILLGKNNNKRFTTSRLFEIRGFYKELINYNLVDLTNGDIIGGIEYIHHYDNYKYDAKCLTNVEVLKVDLVHFNEILIKEEMKIFNKKLERQTDLLSKRIKTIKEEREKMQLKDYITSKNKYTKTFLLNNPLSKKNEYKSELYINSGSNPIKIMKNKYNKKKLNNTKLILNSLNYIEEYKNVKYFNYKSAKSTKILKGVNNFLTSIDNNHRVPVGQIFPTYSSLENIPHTNKKVFYINNNNSFNTNCNSNSNSIYRNNKKNNKKKIKSAIYKNKAFNSISHFNIKKNDNFLNLKTNSYKNVNLKNINKKTIFNNRNFREKLFTHLKNKNNAKSNKCISNINSYRKNNFNIINSD